MQKEKWAWLEIEKRILTDRQANSSWLPWLQSDLSPIQEFGRDAINVKGQHCPLSWMDTGPWFPYRKAKGRVREVLNIFQVFIWNSQKDWTGCTQHLIFIIPYPVLRRSWGKNKRGCHLSLSQWQETGSRGPACMARGIKVNLNPPLLDLNTPSPVFRQAHDFLSPNILKLTGTFWRGTWTSTARGLRGCHVKKLSLPSDQALYDTVV